MQITSHSWNGDVTSLRNRFGVKILNYSDGWQGHYVQRGAESQRHRNWMPEKAWLHIKRRREIVMKRSMTEWSSRKRCPWTVFCTPSVPQFIVYNKEQFPKKIYAFYRGWNANNMHTVINLAQGWKIRDGSQAGGVVRYKQYGMTPEEPSPSSVLNDSEIQWWSQVAWHVWAQLDAILQGQPWGSILLCCWENGGRLREVEGRGNGGWN